MAHLLSPIQGLLLSAPFFDFEHLPRRVAGPIAALFEGFLAPFLRTTIGWCFISWCAGRDARLYANTVTSEPPPSLVRGCRMYARSVPLSGSSTTDEYAMAVVSGSGVESGIPHTPPIWNRSIRRLRPALFLTTVFIFVTKASSRALGSHFVRF